MTAKRTFLAPLGALAVLSACTFGVRRAHEPGECGVGEAPHVALALCEAACARAQRCGEPACTCADVEDTTVLRDDWARVDAACLARAPCAFGSALDDGDADECARIANRAIGVTALAWPPEVLRCLAKGDACGGSFVQCRRLAAMTDAARAEADACFDVGCDAYRACFASFWSARVTPAIPAWRSPPR